MASPDDYRRMSAQARARVDTVAAQPVEQRAMQITQSATPEEMLAFFGLNTENLPMVTVDAALQVPAVGAAVGFLSRALASLPLAPFQKGAKAEKALAGRINGIVGHALNPEWSSFEGRRYFWQQVFTHGRGLMAITRDDSGNPYELWPISPEWTTVTLNSFGERTYTVTGLGMGMAPLSRTYKAADIIDVPFMLSANMVNVKSPIWMGRKAIQLALAMNDYGSSFFAGGGVPPLGLEGPMPVGNDGMQRAMSEVSRVIDAARSSSVPVFPMPPGYKLVPVGFDPQKGQMTEARLFQIQEIARVYQLPPVFLQDLSKATFQNSEQQDLQLVKHLIVQWCKALEDEMSLKLFGFNPDSRKPRRYVRHDLDEMLRGDFLTRMQGLSASVQNGIRTPNEARAAVPLPPHADPMADRLFMQGATVPLGHNGGPPLNDPAKPPDNAAPPPKDDAQQEAQQDDP
jgi:HK97 family phage portal protein